MTTPINPIAGRAPRATPAHDPDLAARRLATAERTKADRLHVAFETMRDAADTTTLDRIDEIDPHRVAVNREADMLASQGPTCVNLHAARAVVAALRGSLLDGSDDRRYAATGAALEALGRLWSVSGT